MHKKDHRPGLDEGHSEDGDLCEALCISISEPTISLGFLIISAERQISKALIPHFVLVSYHNLNTHPNDQKGEDKGPRSSAFGNHCHKITPTLITDAPPFGRGALIHGRNRFREMQIRAWKDYRR